jgi:hypothetical protein
LPTTIWHDAGVAGKFTSLLPNFASTANLNYQQGTVPFFLKISFIFLRHTLVSGVGDAVSP